MHSDAISIIMISYWSAKAFMYSTEQWELDQFLRVDLSDSILLKDIVCMYEGHAT